MKINKTFVLNLFILFLVTISLVLIIFETLNYTRKKEGLVVIEQIKKEENSVKPITSDIYKVLNQNNETEKYKQIILTFYLNDNKSDYKDNKNLNFGAVEAWEVDLDDDNLMEIVGFVCDGYFYGSVGRKIYILKKNNGKYENISYFNAHKPGVDIEILKNKTNGFYDIRFYSALSDNSGKFKSYTVQYKNGKYEQ